ncbi:PepSY-associated TM helix domain-containing protein [Epilithonimonas sp.]|uniref:PepSY-associated TM helix domain-containing protein n=1 Tax=Epilithonimonas sp. TaxID=2894511 RepID=UPI0028A1EC01|nr:PepSY-associated TM helix domain-containing protein [Epilithonimonas sp.]
MKKKNKPSFFKKLVSTVHLWVGLVVGLVFVLVAASGAVLSFEDELEPVIYPEFYFAKDGSNTNALLPIKNLLESAKQHSEDKKIARIVLTKDLGKGGNVLFVTAGSRLERSFIGVNPYNGKVQNVIKPGRNLFTWMEEFHRKLIMGKIGKTITGICCIAYILIILTGIILWWPKNKNILKQRTKIKWDASAKRLNWDFHAVGGIYSAPLLMLMCLTGITWSYPIFKSDDDIKFNTNSHKISAQTYEMLSQEYYLKARNENVTIGLPDKKKDYVNVSIGKDDFYYHPETSALLRDASYEKISINSQIKSWMKPLHTGSAFGFIGKLIYFLVTLIGVSLPITGFTIWFGKKKKKKPNTYKKAIA